MSVLWKKWEGGERPVDADAIVAIKWGDGATTYDEVAGHYDWAKRRGKKMVIVGYAA